MPVDYSEIIPVLQQHETFRDQVETLTKSINSLKKRLGEVLDQYGEEDHNGHLVLPLPQQVGRVTSLVKQRKVSQGFDEDEADEILHSKVVDEVTGDTLWDTCTDLVPVLDEDKVWAAFYDGLLTQEEIDRMYPKTVSYAFTPQRVKA